MENQDNQYSLMTTKEAAKYLRLSRQTLYRNDINVPRIKIGRKIMFLKDQLDQYLAQCVEKQLSGTAGNFNA